MQKIMTSMPVIRLVGISARTSNANEMDQGSARIGYTVGSYFENGFPAKIKDRTAPGKTYCVYSDYETDHTGDYTFFVGEEVSSFDEVDDELETLTIPAQNYAKFTNGPGPMPAVCIDAWQEIWGMTPTDLGGERAYLGDFEIYDERASDPANVTLDVYVGVKS